MKTSELRTIYYIGPLPLPYFHDILYINMGKSILV